MVSLYAHAPVRTADLWKIYLFLFPELKAFLSQIQLKFVVKKISELDHRVSVPRTTLVVSVASKYEAKNRW